MTYNMGSVALNTDWGVFGLSMVAVDYGDFERTIRADNEKGFLDVARIAHLPGQSDSVMPAQLPTASQWAAIYASPSNRSAMFPWGLKAQNL